MSRLQGIAHFLIALAAAMMCGVNVSAQPYPTRTIQIVAPFTPGGGVDLMARLVAARLSESFGQSVVIDNRTGAGGAVGADFVARAAPDGYTLLVGNNSTHGVSQAVNPKLSYDTIKSFTSISLIAAAPNLLLTGPSVPVKSLNEFIALAKMKPGELNFGSSGIGSQNHLSGELFNYMAGTKIVHVPYRGSIGPGFAALLAGEIQLFWASTTGATQHISTGRLKALAITGVKRTQVAPEVPTFLEQGVKGFETGPWYALLGPASLPSPITTLLHREVVALAATGSFQKKLAGEGAEPIASTPAECADTISKELAKWTRLIKETGIQIN